MPDPRPDVLDFLLTRRSRPAKTLGNAAPGPDQMRTLLTAASRTPDHGKLVPWRFVIVPAEAQDRIAGIFTRHAEAAGLDAPTVEKNARSFTFGGVVVAVIACPRPSPKIPGWEQELAAGAVCLALVNAALAAGWGANWLTGPLARDAGFLSEAFGCAPGEFAAGFVHIGDETVAPADRDRPQVDQITTWL